MRFREDQEMKGNALKPFLIILCVLAYHAAWIVWSREVENTSDSLQMLMLMGSLGLTSIGWLFVYQYATAKVKNQEDKDDLQIIKHLFIIIVVVQFLSYAMISNYYFF